MGSTDQRARSKRAYELGRVRLGLRAALPAIPMAALSLFACGRPEVTLVFGALLFVTATALGVRGQAYGRALMPGFLAGVAPLVLPVALRSSGHCCIGNMCWPVCMLGCIGGGLIAGVAIGLAAARERADRTTFLLAASLVAGLAGVLGCAMIGASGIAGMAIAVAASSLPVTLAANARA